MTNTQAAQLRNLVESAGMSIIDRPCPRRIVGYNVYEAREGDAEIFLGFVTSLDEARTLADTASGGLPEHMYETARVAGHCDGMKAPDRAHESDEPAEYTWFGPEGYHCAVPIFSTGEAVDD